VSERTPVDAIAPALSAATQAGLWPARAALFHDLDRLDARLDALVDAFPRETLHAIAIKANPLVALLRRIVVRGLGLEAASWEEVACALAAGCPPERIVFDSPAKTDDELREALSLGITINVDHAGELARLAAAGATRANRIGLRVNPMVGVGTIAQTSTVGRSSKFGVSMDDARSLVAAYPFVTGLHVHTGSQGVGLQLIQSAVEAVGALARELGLRWLDVGGGIPVRYRDTDPAPPTFAAWGESLAAVHDLALITEAGRSVLAPSGFAVSRIEGVKTVDGVSTLVVHLGADLLLRRVYRGEQWDHEFVVLDPDGRPKDGPRVPTNVAGPLCFSGDLIARGRPLAHARRGDLLLIRDTGAYTLSMWSRHCSRGLPPSIGVGADGAVLLHAGEQPEDVVRFWS
jgi:diaminopimelate decarboxylase